jgi:hypothetical protein
MSFKKMCVVVAILASPVSAIAANAWYLVEAQCSSDDSRDSKIYKFTSVMEAAGPRSSKAQDDARFSFKSLVAEQVSGKYCKDPVISTQDSSASYVGDSKAEADKSWNDYVKRDLAKKKPWLRHVTLDVDAMNAKVKLREDQLAAEEGKKKKAVTDKLERENQAALDKAKERKQKHDAWCEAEGTAKGYCSCPLPPGAKTCTK